MESKRKSPELSASLLSLFTFSWTFSILKEGYGRTLEAQDLWELVPEDQVMRLTKTLTSEMKSVPRIWMALWRLERRKFVVAGICKLMGDLLGFAGPIFLRLFVDWIEKAGKLEFYPFAMIIAMFLSTALANIFLQMHHHLVIRAGTHIRAATMQLIYEKALKLPQSLKQSLSVGKITNLMSTDAQRLNDFSWFVHYLWAAPLQVIICLVLLVVFIGPVGLISIGLLLTLLVCQTALFRKIGKLTKKVLAATDKRVGLLNELFQGIRAIKFYAWEESFRKEINEVRDQEIHLIAKKAFFLALNSLILLSYPVLVALVTFYSYSKVYSEPLTPGVAFAALSLFGILRLPVFIFPRTIQTFINAKESIRRLDDFLQSEELPPPFQMNLLRGQIFVQSTNFNFQKKPLDSNRDLLHVKDLNIAPGELVLCVGPVGSGKSSLINALIGEMYSSTEFTKFCGGSVSYSAQTAWIINDTVKNNILFGRPLDIDRYNRAIAASALADDLKILPAGEESEIGERGINLSGGQKQRVSLARAIYGDSDVYIFDDPLSALDVHIGNHVFDECLIKLLHGKTRFVATHHVRFADRVDKIVVMRRVQDVNNSHELEIIESGTFEELKAKKSYFWDMYESFHLSEAENLNQNESVDDFDAVKTPYKSNVAVSQISENSPEKGKLIGSEFRDKGEVNWKIYISYIKSAGASLFFVFFFFLALSRGLQAGSDVWLGIWTTDLYSQSVSWYLNFYAIFSVSTVFSIFISVFFLAVFGVFSARKLFRLMLDCLLHCPVVFYDITPLGRILNRFSRDIDAIDNSLPSALEQYFSGYLNLLSVFALIIAVTYWFAIALLPIMGVFFLIQNYYRKSSRELKRLDSITKSPVFAHFSESLSGLSTIRIFDSKKRFLHRTSDLIDENNKAFLILNFINRWLGVRLDFLGAIVLLSSTMLILAVYGNPNIAALAGLIITYSLNLTSSLNWIVRSSLDFENQLNSVERVTEYSQLPSEGNQCPESVPSDSWPNAGEIIFKDVSCRYRKELDLVLQKISLTFEGGKMIGVVGRTGSGKSSLMNLIFRILECESGSILIDNVDISKLHLSVLRSRLSIIPQDPILFSGSVRFNLDPFDNYSDEQIWKSLAAVQMDGVVESLPDKIHALVSEGGSNFSVGQRQLFCLARAILRRSRIIVCDEATASVDHKTDALIQEMIRREFQGCTVLTIAHRLETILDYDKVLVLDKGKVAEFASPTSLLQDPNSLFASMLSGVNSSSKQ